MSAGAGCAPERAFSWGVSAQAKPGVPVTRLVSLLAVLVLAAGLLPGGTGPVRALGTQHHAHHHAALHETDSANPCGTAGDHASTPCVQHHPDDRSVPDKAPKAHAHGTADCLCLTGACDLAGLPARTGTPHGHRVATVLPGGEAAPVAIAHAPPLPPPRA